MSNRQLNKAKAKGNDEYYTPLHVIESEVMHYREHFKDKVVYLNCDDPRESAFFFYFSMNFERLGLKKLISSCYKNQDFNLFSMHDKNEEAVWLEYNGAPEGHRMPTVESIGVNKFKGDGDFRSQESIELLKQADIIVTNPPFSIFREYVAQLIEYDKKFLILGNMNAITYRDFFPLLVDNKVWPGTRFRSTIDFIVPDDTTFEKSGYIGEDGKKYIPVQGVTWWTNLEYPRRKQDMILFRRYYDSPEKYPKYDNLDAINVDKVADIPQDYKGAMGVPITFLGQYNPEQFKILGHTTLAGYFTLNKTYKNPRQVNAKGIESRSNKINGTAVLAHDEKPPGAYHLADNSDKYFTVPYGRILIQNKYLNPEIYVPDEDIE